MQLRFADEATITIWLMANGQPFSPRQQQNGTRMSAMVEELSALAKSLETYNDPTAIRHTKAAVMKTKNLIGQVQDPMHAVMDHITNLTAAGIFKELKLGVWAHNRPSLILSTHANFPAKYFFEISKTSLPTPKTPHSWNDNKLGSTFWEVLNSEPKRVEAFARSLSLFDAIHPVASIYPFEEHHQAGYSPDRTLAVGIGGRPWFISHARCEKGLPNSTGPNGSSRTGRRSLTPFTAEDLYQALREWNTTSSRHSQFKGGPNLLHPPHWLGDEAGKILMTIVPAMAPDWRNTDLRHGVARTG
ncbi:hypothetical protein GJ744_010988 [Endocarpon pusillum]|uniref:Uncharacterized protein n=1 Tax=Endocarpon pusillum TaxID=364733 RepID=A0A8H7ADD9_9EURO|nr:hypothetical protein GJ744_010988 [Endocarpon pusillum]